MRIADQRLKNHLSVDSFLGMIQFSPFTGFCFQNLLRPLHLAAQNDHVPSANVLVQDGKANVDPQTQTGYSPLHVASHFGQAGMVRYLLQNGADVHLTTEAGNTPLHHAAQQGQTLIITLLLEKKADPDAVNKARDKDYICSLVI